MRAMPGFPVRKLVPVSGSIEAMIAGSPARLCWKLHVRFARMGYEGEMVEPILGSDTLTIPVRDWRDLEGRTIEGSNPGEGGAPPLEATFYVWDHDVVVRTQLKIGARQRLTFHTAWDVLVDFTGFTGDDADSQLRVRAELEVPFRGLTVVKDAIPAKRRTVEAAKRLAAEHLDLKQFREPVLEGTAFHFEPRPMKRMIEASAQGRLGDE
jgi:hypothetical protein